VVEVFDFFEGGMVVVCGVNYGMCFEIVFKICEFLGLFFEVYFVVDLMYGLVVVIG